MAAPADYTHHIRTRSTQLEIATPGGAHRDVDYDRKLRDAQEELERIQIQRDELERKKIELEELTGRKREFLSQQVELTEKLTSALTLIDRELFEMRQESEDLEQCRVCFAAHLDKIQKFNPESWTRDQLSEKLDKASMAIDIAADEYDQASNHFEGGRSGAIFGRSSSRGRTATRKKSDRSEFMANFSNGLAFNLPIVILGTIALVVYILNK